VAITAEQLGPPSAESAAPIVRAGTPDLAIKVVAYIVLIAFAFAMFVPFIFSIITSLKTQREANQLLSLKSLFWPENPTLEAYHTVFDSEIDRWFLNSVLVATIWVIARAFTAATAGYAFARMQFPGKNVLFVMVLATIMIPGMVTIVPKFLILKELGLINTYGALTLPFAADAFAIFLMKQYFESIPTELEEAARVDGASRYRMFLQIILPNAMPALTALAIFSFQGSWNAFLEPLILINNADLFTMPLGLAYFRNANYTDWQVLMAGVVVSTLPIVIFYLIFQRWFVSGQVSSGIKG
jgi:multiple sugar transport system permease protein